MEHFYGWTENSAFLIYPVLDFARQIYFLRKILWINSNNCNIVTAFCFARTSIYLEILINEIDETQYIDTCMNIEGTKELENKFLVAAYNRFFKTLL